MKVLVVGGGGREHAIVEALRRSGAELYAVMANQNPGIRRAAKDVLLGDVTAVDRIVEWAKGRSVELAVIGPEAPLAAGIVDQLDASGIPAVGPSQEAAQLETNKAFTRELMKEHQIPGLPRYWVFDELGAFEAFVNDSDFEFVIKPLGLTGGKGVKVWGDHFASKSEALAYGREILEKKIGGFSRFLVEEKLIGEEFSLQAFCDGRTLVPTPIAQDHKRAYEGDKGPNTGGMGSYSYPDHLLPFLTREDFEGALTTMRETVAAMESRGTPFKGILYGGFMATKDGAKLLEFNVRFADPEAMNVLPILEDDFLEACVRLTDGRLPASLRFARKATVCKYVVPMGYGSHPKAGEQLKVDEDSIRQLGAKLFYASVDQKGGHLYTTTSR
ncbi:MAG: phosphoribosylamine--glycine ligase, partial [Thermoplasmata archaeon]